MAKSRPIPISSIHVPEDYLRPVDETAALGLSRLLKEEGQKAPIAVYRSNAKGEGRQYTLIYGARRLWAARHLGWVEIEAFLHPASDAHMLALTDNLSMPALKAIEQAEYFTAYRAWWEKKYGPVERGGSRKSNGHGGRLVDVSHNEEKYNFYKDITEKFQFSERTARRLYSIGRNLHPMLGDRLRGTGWDNDQRTLMKLARMPSDQQVRIAAALGELPDLKVILRMADPETGREASGRMETGDWREAQFVDAWKGMPRDRRAAALDKIGAVLKPLDPWPKEFPPLPAIPAAGNKSPLWRMLHNPFEQLSPKLTYAQIQAHKAKYDAQEKEAEYSAEALAGYIQAIENARREEYNAQRDKAKAKASRSKRKPKIDPAVRRESNARWFGKTFIAPLAAHLIARDEQPGSPIVRLCQKHKSEFEQWLAAVVLANGSNDFEELKYRLKRFKDEPERDAVDLEYFEEWKASKRKSGARQPMPSEHAGQTKH